jgi:hypothetical protein
MAQPIRIDGPAEEGDELLDPRLGLGVTRRSAPPNVRFRLFSSQSSQTASGP